MARQNLQKSQRKTIILNEQYTKLQAEQQKQKLETENQNLRIVDHKKQKYIKYLEDQSRQDSHKIKQLERALSRDAGQLEKGTSCRQFRTTETRS